MISQMKALEDENRRLKKMYAEMSMQSELLKEAFMADRLGPSHACKHALPGNGWSGVSAVERAGRL